MSNPTSGIASRPNLQDLMRLIPAELQNSSIEEKMNYLKTLVARNVSRPEPCSRCHLESHT